MMMQRIEVGGNLSSRKSETSFKKGRFRLRLGDDGNLQLLTLNSDTLADSDVYFPYYSSGTTGPNPGVRLVFNQTGYMYVLRNDNSTSTFNKEVPVSSKDFYHRAVLHFDGVWAQYYHPKEQGNRWVSVWAVPDDMCLKNNDLAQDLGAKELGTTACGFNSICILGDDKRPSCECPEKFVLKDQSDEYGDCEPDFEMQTCDANYSNTDLNVYEFITLEKTNWPSGDYQRYSNFDEKRCKDSCLNDCFCGAAVLGRDGFCWKKKFPLSYGRRSLDGESDTFVKVLKRGKEVSVTEKRVKDHVWLIIIGSVLLGASAFVNIIFFGLYRKKKKSRKTKKRPESIGEAGATAMELNLRVFTYGELVEATGDFMEELGRGAFGIVYKGLLKVNKDSEVIVAVKKLDRVAQEKEKEFKNEVKVVSDIHIWPNKDPAHNQIEDIKLKSPRHSTSNTKISSAPKTAHSSSTKTEYKDKAKEKTKDSLLASCNRFNPLQSLCDD